MFRIIDWVERLCERIVYGPEDDSNREVSQALDRAFRHEPDNFVDSWLLDFKKKERLSQELTNAEWILNYEKRLARLQKQTARQRSRAKQRGVDIERLQKLEHHLAGRRRSLSLD
jgi:hypothetical protein